jgi:hypothetical protein
MKDTRIENYTFRKDRMLQWKKGGNMCLLEEIEGEKRKKGFLQ